LFLCYFDIFRRLPSSILLPYTTLFRSLTVRIPSALSAQATKEASEATAVILCSVILKFVAAGLRFGKEPEKAVSDAITKGITDRSEEHTSELQSRENLVCRLLLEKKKF